jgi:DNA-directed RNA polymerase specialized sigma24 family protein
MTPEFIVSGILQNQEPAILALYDGIWKNRNALSRRSGRALEPEDQAQEIFITSWGAIRLGRLDNPAALWSFVDTIRYRINCRAFRSRVLFVDFDMARRMMAAPERTDALAIKHELDDCIEVVMQALGESDRRVLQMFYQEGRTAVEIQAEMHLDAKNFHLKKSDAMRRFLVILNKLRSATPCSNMSSI